MNRKKFITASLLAGTTALLNPGIILKKSELLSLNSGKKMRLKFYPYTLELKHVFTIATSSRKTTPVILTELEHDGITGYGEGSMPPYLGETHETAIKFLSKINLDKFTNPFHYQEILEYVDNLDTGNSAAKAAFDIALFDLLGKKLKSPWYKIWGLDENKTPYTSFTIGIDTPDVVRQKVKEAEQYKILKVKLGRENDKEMIEVIRSVTDKPIRCDANQGWKDKSEALKMIEWLAKYNIEFVEQPLDKNNLDDHAWLKERSPLPIIADESLQRLKDIRKLWGAYHGINIKLMKCTGLNEAYKMIVLARALDMKIMIGCMTETTCAISAAAQLSPLVDWADLDGAELISNDIFDGTKIIDGKVKLSDMNGIGVKKIKK